MLYLDLNELPHLFDGVPFWSARRRAPAWFKRSDYYGPQDQPLDDAVRDLVESRLGTRPTGPIRLLTHLRYFGYIMNPVSFYYCFDARGERLETIVAEITNTPWKERFQYVLAVAGAAPTAQNSDIATREKKFDFAKRFHVSPFLPMDLGYRWRFSDPEERLLVHMENFDHGERLFDATLSLRAEPISAAALLKTLAGFPLMTIKVVAAIHWQALKLWFKRTPIFDHPNTATRVP